MIRLETILEDIKDPRTKKIILDGDYNGEIDDQYTLATLSDVRILRSSAFAHQLSMRKDALRIPRR